MVIKVSCCYGIPLAEIAFIHEADTPAKKAALFKAVNVGRVRVLIGSTSKLGTGVNVQRRLVALHHVDEPWKPAELEQREGRILRQGNIYQQVYLFHYVTERSFDGYMLQTLESKARFISQILAGEVTARTAEDVGDMVLTVAQVKAIASGNPMVQRRIELEVKLVKLDRLRASYYNNRAAMRADLEELPQAIAAQEAELEGHEQAVKERQPLEEDKFSLTLKKKLGDAEAVSFDKRERAGAHIRYLADLLLDELRRGAGRGSLTEEVGTYRGFKISVYVSGNSRFVGTSSLFNFQSEIHLRAADGGTCYIAQIGESNVGITQSIDYQLRHLEDRLEQTRAGLEMLRTRLATVRVEVDKPWAHAAEYRRLRKEYEAMGAALQAEGIEVESTTTFTAEEGEAETDNAEGEHGAESAGTVTAKAASTDELGARRNPLTGLEDWPIIVEEQPDGGLRKGSILPRKYSELHLDAKVPFVHVERTKNGEPIKIPLSQLAVDAIKGLPSFGKSEYLFPAKPNVRFKEVEKFSKPHAWDIGKRFRRVCRLAGVNDLRIHDLRHYATTVLFMRGIPDPVISKMTGHKSRELKRYQHLSPLFKQQTVDLIAEELGNALGNSTDTPTDTRTKKKRPPKNGGRNSLHH